jgi:tetratricopeptide (TPR) repeat protein
MASPPIDGLNGIPEPHLMTGESKMQTREAVQLALLLLLALGPMPVQGQVTKRQDARSGEDTLLQRYDADRQAHNWLDAQDALERLLALRPGHWAYQQALGDVELNLGRYPEALQSYEAARLAAGRGIERPSATDSAEARAAIAQLLTSEGNAYLKLKRDPEAIAAFTKAAEMSPHPGVAYFDLCATLYNMGNEDAGLAACDRAIEADPTKADAYFVKASLLFAKGNLDAQNKFVVPPGTVEALTAYLGLAPDGSHAIDVKAMLDALGVKVPTTYQPSLLIGKVTRVTVVRLGPTTRGAS